MDSDIKTALKLLKIEQNDLMNYWKRLYSTKKTFLILVISLLVFIMSPSTYAEEVVVEEEESEEQEVIPLMYFDIDPKVLTFYQSTGRKIGYVVVQINLAVKGQENLELVELHSPLIQDNLIDFFNRQDKKTIQDFSEREGLRQKAQESVAAVLEAEVGKNIIESLLFTDYVYQ
ncbi:MAG: flagellar FliL protein [Polaribacter sp.]|jgi:flagellar FliL protein